jgi:hypothetical protein
MPTRAYAFDKKGPARLEVRFEPTFEGVTLLLDGAPVGEVASASALRQKPRFPLPDGTVLELSPREDGTWVEPFLVTRDGKPLHVPRRDPRERLASGVHAVYLAAGLLTVLSLTAMATGSRYLVESLSFGWASLGFALLVAFLGFVSQRGSVPALIAAAGLLGAGALWFLVRAVQAEQPRPLWPIPATMFLLIPILYGISALRELAPPRPPKAPKSPQPEH